MFGEFSLLLWLLSLFSLATLLVLWLYDWLIHISLGYIYFWFCYYILLGYNEAFQSWELLTVFMIALLFVLFLMFIVTINPLESMF